MLKAQGSTMIAYRPLPTARRLKGGAGVFSLAGKENQPACAMTMEVAIAGEDVWNSPTLTAREQTARFDAPLNNATRVKSRTRAVGNNASCWAAWLNPVIVK